MKNGLLSDLKNVDFVYIFILLITLFCCYVFIGHSGLLLYDIGREAYFPVAILNGDVLYKDIFNLFGPLSYLITAFVYKLLGVSMDSLYVIGYASSILLISGIYNLAKEFMERKYAAFISLFAILVGVVAMNYSNSSFTLPYAHSIVYGFIAFIWSLYFLAQFNNKNGSRILLVLSVLLAGMSVACKYEFVIFGLIYMIYVSAICFRKQAYYSIITLIICFLLPSVLCFGYLFNKGLTFKDLLYSFELVKNIINTPSYQYFYRTTGAILCSNNIILILHNIIVFFMFTLSFYLTDKYIKSRLNRFLIIFAVFCLFYRLIYVISSHYYVYDSALSFMPLLISIIFIIKFKTLSNISKFLVISSIAVSYKVFWGCYIGMYGNYFFPILLIALFAMINDKDIKNAFVLYITQIMLFYTLVYGFNLFYMNTCVSSHKGEICTDASVARQVNRIINYLNDHTDKNDKVVVYPEGLIINFLTERKSDSWYYALGPAYVELFGEINIINHFKENKPEYFVIVDRYMAEYNSGTFCDNYGKNICAFIKQNYKQVAHYTLYDNYSTYAPAQIYKRID